MAILNYTTYIDCEKSISEIQKCLVKHGAHKIVTEYAIGFLAGFCTPFIILIFFGYKKYITHEQNNKRKTP